MAATELFETLQAVYITSATQRAFIEGDLSGQLRGGYPELFDDDDLALVRPGSQPDKLVKNWMAAIDLFQRKGWHSLQDPYFKTNHGLKHDRMKELLPEAVAALVTRHGAVKGAEPPNLLAFDESPDGTMEWRFVHVVRVEHGEKPRLEPEKDVPFRELALLTERPIVLVPFRVGVPDAPQLQFKRLS